MSYNFNPFHCTVLFQFLVSITPWKPEVFYISGGYREELLAQNRGKSFQPNFAFHEETSHWNTVQTKWLVSTKMQHWIVMYQAPEESLRLNNVRSYKTLAETCNVSSFLKVGITPIIQNLPEKKKGKSAPEIKFTGSYPASIYLFKINSRNIRTMCEICSKLTIKV